MKTLGYGGCRFHHRANVRVGGGSRPAWLQEREERVERWDRTPLTTRVCPCSLEQYRITTVLTHYISDGPWGRIIVGIANKYRCLEPSQ